MRKSKTKKEKIYLYAISIALVLVATLVGEFVKRKLEPTNIVMFYLLAVVIAAIQLGQGPAIVTSILGVICFDFFLIPPYLTFNVSQIQYIFTFVGLLAVGLVVSTFASKTRDRLIQYQTEKLQTALLNSITHDLRTPLASITGALTVLLNKESNLDDPTKNEMLETAHDQADRLNRLVGNLLDITKMEAGALRISKKPCELRDVIGAALNQLKEKIGPRNIKIDISKDFPDVPMDFFFIMKVFVNIIDNALKYSPLTSPITIRAYIVESLRELTLYLPKTSQRNTNAWAKIEIQDQGSGIAENDLQHIFEKFYRAEKPQQISGTGLGLSICKGIVEAHSGTITAKNNPDKGAILTIMLPLDQKIIC
jgi:two-component system sensor histidine kinase KdpD